MRSETPRAPMGPEAPAQRKALNPLKTFHATAQSSLFKKTPSTIAASKTMGTLTDVFPEYKYKDVYYNGGRAQNMDYNTNWQEQFDSSIVPQNANGMTSSRSYFGTWNKALIRAAIFRASCLSLAGQKQVACTICRMRLSF